MACSSCGSKQQAQTNLVSLRRVEIVVGPCFYTKEELETKLIIALNSLNWNQVTFLKSAINRYEINCNEFNDYIL